MNSFKGRNGHLVPALLLGLLLVFSFSQQTLAQQLRLATTNYPPFYGEDLPNGGPFSQIARQAFEDVGYEVTIDFIPWARALEWAAEGKVDGLLGAWITPERKDYFVETVSVMSNTMVFYRKRNSKTTFDSFDDLAKQKLWIGTVYGYAQPRGLIEAGVNLIYATQDKQLFMLLGKGRIDLVVVDKTFAELALALPDMQEHRENVEHLEGFVEQRDMHILMSKNLTNADEIAQAFNKGLAILKKDGRFQQIVMNVMSGTEKDKLIEFEPEISSQAGSVQ